MRIVKRMKRRWISSLLAIGVAAVLLPVRAFAIEGIVELDMSDGAITITENGYTQGAAAEVPHQGAYVVQGSGTYPITIQSGTIELILSGLQITAETAPAIRIDPGATLNLQVTGENHLTGGAGFAAVCVAPAYDSDINYDAESSAKLYLSGDGSLTAHGGNGDAAAGTFGGGAGIGGNGEDQHGGDSVDFGLVCITNGFTGTLMAAGGASSAHVDGANAFGGGAGIGSGGFNMGYINNYQSMSLYYWGEVVGNIEVHGGTIVASSNGNGAGIGGGGGLGEDTAASSINVTITGGKIEATGGALGAGIGGGAICDGGNISISGQNTVVQANAGAHEDSMGAAGIGGGNDASVMQVNITGGSFVTATASGGAAGIGGGTNTSYSPIHYGDEDGNRTPAKVGKITISGAGTTVSARGGTGTGFSGQYGGAGIGAGYPTANNDRSVAFDIAVLDHASLRAYGGYHAQAIGYGYRPTDYIGYGITLTLEDTIFLWAQNADYYQPALVAATVYDADPIAYGSSDVYLTHYVDVDKNAASAGSANVAGYLKQPATASDRDFIWQFDGEKKTVTIGDNTVVDQVEGLNGNWATLCRLKREANPTQDVRPDPSPSFHPEPTQSIEPDLDPPQTGDGCAAYLHAVGGLILLSVLLMARAREYVPCERRLKK